MAKKISPPTTSPLVANTAAGIIETQRQEALLKTGALQNAIFNSANFSKIATDENGVIQLFAIMILYALFIPNSAKSAACVVLPMAFAVAISQMLIFLRPEVIPTAPGGSTGTRTRMARRATQRGTRV